jgi:Holliday junction resolvasome RuvABC ATP-dependent DNA helicase subunit
MKLIIKKIQVPTILNEDQSVDRFFFEYLDEYSISHQVISYHEATDSEFIMEGYPLVEYTGGVISLTNMLKERFGYSREEIEEYYPELIGE